MSGGRKRAGGQRRSTFAPGHAAPNQLARSRGSRARAPRQLARWRRGHNGRRRGGMTKVGEWRDRCRNSGRSLKPARFSKSNLFALLSLRFRQRAAPSDYCVRTLCIKKRAPQVARCALVASCSLQVASCKLQLATCHLHAAHPPSFLSAEREGGGSKWRVRSRWAGRGEIGTSDRRVARDWNAPLAGAPNAIVHQMCHSSRELVGRGFASAPHKTGNSFASWPRSSDPTAHLD